MRYKVSKAPPKEDVVKDQRNSLPARRFRVHGLTSGLNEGVESRESRFQG